VTGDEEVPGMAPCDPIEAADPPTPVFGLWTIQEIRGCTNIGRTTIFSQVLGRCGCGAKNPPSMTLSKMRAEDPRSFAQPPGSFPPSADPDTVGRQSFDAFAVFPGKGRPSFSKIDGTFADLLSFLERST
jgi:hypothetical protein